MLPIAAAWLAGCDPLRILDAHIVEILIEGDAEATVETVISQDFGVTPGAQGLDVFLVLADTAHLSTPHQQSFDVREKRQLFIRILGTDPEGRDVVLSVWIDGDLHHHVDGWPADAPHIEFIYLGGN